VTGTEFDVRVSLIIMAVLAVQAAASPSMACPVCDTGTGEQVRAGILNEKFGSTLVRLSHFFGPRIAQFFRAIRFMPGGFVESEQHADITNAVHLSRNCSLRLRLLDSRKR